MALLLTVHAPTIGGSLTLYETGAMETGRLYPQGIGSVVRRVDLYTGRDSVASAGVVRTRLDNRDGLFSPDGIFAPQWRDVILLARIDNRVAFAGRAERIREGTAGVQVTVDWRDLVDDLLAQQVDGVTRRAMDTDVLAATDLNDAVMSFGIDPAGLPPTNLWLPERATTVRRWLLPVLAALGYSVDWTAAVGADGAVTAGFVTRSESAFGNEADIPRFTDDHLVGDPKWDSGREQVLNLWEGTRRFWDATELRWERDDVQAFGSVAPFAVPTYSREHFGDRKARIDLSNVRDTAERIAEIADTVINRRAWPHVRGQMTLRGPEAAALRIGDGFLTDFALGVAAGRGLSATWRVQGRTVDLLTETTTVYCEQRDGRDEDYDAWVTAGANSTTAA